MRHGKRRRAFVRERPADLGRRIHIRPASRAAARALELLGVVEVILAAQPILSDLFGFAEKMLLN